MATSYIGADVDSKMTDLAVERNGRIGQRFRVPTTITALREVLEQIPAPKQLALEEGSMAQWLYDNLRDLVERLVVCDPRRNKLIDQDGDKDDAIDAAKLATLLRGGFLREVHHSDQLAHVTLKQWVGLYHDRVREAVRQVNKLRGRARMFGLRPPRGALRIPTRRPPWLAELGSHPLANQMRLLWLGYDAAVAQVAIARREMLQQAQGCSILDLWQQLPGIGPVRALTLYAYLETPWRFANNPKKLWKYCGVGLVRTSSGKDSKGRLKVGRLQLAWQVNRRLKDAVMGAAISAIGQETNVFAEEYRRMTQAGMSPGNARHAVARKLLSVLWSMWKTMTPFDPRWVREPAWPERSACSAGGVIPSH